MLILITYLTVLRSKGARRHEAPDNLNLVRVLLNRASQAAQEEILNFFGNRSPQILMRGVATHKV